MKKICFLVTSLDSGGVENYLLRFLQFKGSVFSKVIIFCKSGEAGQLEREYLKIPNVEIKKLKVGFFDIGGFIKVRKYFVEESFDTICDFSGNFSGIYMFLAKMAGIDNRTSFYRESREQFKKSFIKVFYSNFVKHLTYKYSSSILSNSQEAIDYFFDKYTIDSRFYVVKNGIDYRRFKVLNPNLRSNLGFNETDIVIGHVGRYTEAKNHLFILAVAEKLIRFNKDVKFLLCGNDVSTALQSEVDSLGLRDNFILLEFRNDIPDILNVMDIFFFPSLSEGQPNALIEAMISNKPFVSSDLKCIRECLPEFCFEFLVDPRNIDDAYTKLISLISFPNRENVLKTSQWAKDMYDSNVQFDVFYKKL